MNIFVGSYNRVKINAVAQAVQAHWPTAEVTGYAVNSGVSSQPLTDEETQQGAVTRAKNALAAGIKHFPELNVEEVIGVGLEGGVTPWQNELWSTVWGAVVDRHGRVFTANGVRIQLPKVIAQPILEGAEMGPLMEKLVGISDVRSHQGMIGVVTQNFVNRTEEYRGVAKLAIGLWFGQDWDVKLS